MYDLIEKLFLQKNYLKCEILISEDEIVNLFYDGSDKLGEYYFVSKINVYELFNKSYTEVLSDKYYEILLHKNKYKCKNDILSRGDIDKNSSLILLINSSDLKAEDESKWNSILLNIEEDELYFKKYVLEYNDANLKNLSKHIGNKPQEEILIYLKEHFEELKVKRDEVAVLALRIIAKTPFFDYFKFDKESIANLSIKDNIGEKLKDDLKNIHDELVETYESSKADNDEKDFIDAINFYKYMNEIEKEKEIMISKLGIAWEKGETDEL